MTSDLLIGYPDIPFLGTMFTEPASETGYDAEYAITGERGNYYIALSSVSSSIFEFDMGAATTRTPEYMALMRADLMRRHDSADCTWSVVGSAASNFASPVTASGTFAIADLLGPRDEDYLTSLVGLSAKRYWRFQVNSTASFKHQLSKVYFGNWFDFGRDPIFPADKAIEYKTDGDRAPRYILRLDWLGITNTVRNDFISKILKWRDVNPILLNDTSGKILDGNRLLHCIITECTFTPRGVNYSDVSLGLEEII